MLPASCMLTWTSTDLRDALRFSGATLSATGTGTATDRARAYAWYALAASRGNTFAAVSRNRLMTDRSWEELNRAQAVAVDLYREIEELPPRPAAAEMGTPAATAP